MSFALHVSSPEGRVQKDIFLIFIYNIPHVRVGIKNIIFVYIRLYSDILAQLQESVDAPAADHPNNTTKRYMKKGRSFTPLNCALNPLIFELRDSADALVDRFTK